MRHLIFLLLFSPLFLQGSPLLVVTEDRPPYAYLDSNDEIAGLATRRVKQLLTATDIEFNIKLFPWARALEYAKTQPNTLIYPILKTPQRVEMFHWFCPLLDGFPIYLFKLAKRDDIQIQTLAEAKSFRVGVSRGDWNESFLLQQGFSYDENLDVSADEHANLLQLLAERVDMVLVTENSVIERLKKLNYAFDRVSKVLPTDFKHNTPLCMALNKESDNDTVVKLNNALSQLWLESQRGGRND